MTALPETRIAPVSAQSGASRLGHERGVKFEEVLQVLKLTLCVGGWTSRRRRQPISACWMQEGRARFLLIRSSRLEFQPIMGGRVCVRQRPRPSCRQCFGLGRNRGLGKRRKWARTRQRPRPAMVNLLTWSNLDIIWDCRPRSALRRVQDDGGCR